MGAAKVLSPVVSHLPGGCTARPARGRGREERMLLGVVLGGSTQASWQSSLEKSVLLRLGSEIKRGPRFSDA